MDNLSFRISTMGVLLWRLKLLNLSAKLVCCILMHRDLKLLLLVLSFWKHWFSEACSSTVSSKRGSWWHCLSNCWLLPHHEEACKTWVGSIIMRRSLFIPSVFPDLSRKHKALVATGSHLPPWANIRLILMLRWQKGIQREDGCWWRHPLMTAHALNLLTSRFQLFSDVSF